MRFELSRTQETGYLGWARYDRNNMYVCTICGIYLTVTEAENPGISLIKHIEKDHPDATRDHIRWCDASYHIEDPRRPLYPSYLVALHGGEGMPKRCAVHMKDPKATVILK
jgi:hypothetical protein